MSVPGLTFFASAGAPVLLLGLTYAIGARRRIYAGRVVANWRHAAFMTGLTLLFLSTQWPFAQWAHQMFYVHQIGIMVARIAAPMLIAMAHPAGMLISGLPRSLRTRALKPGISATAARQIWRLIRLPAPSLFLYVATLYFWEVPTAQAAAITETCIGLFMHLCLLLSGLLFWTRIFERRPPPHGATHGQRLMMVWLAVLMQIGLGAYITVKANPLYHVYAATERAAMIAPITDEGRGGFFIWVPSALLSSLALIVVLDMWGRHESKMDAKRTRWSPSNSAILLYPQTGRQLREMSRGKNRRLALAMAAFSLMIFSVTSGFIVGAHYINRRENMRLYALSRK